MISVHLDAGSKKKKKQANVSSVAASSSPAAPPKSRGKASKAGERNGKNKGKKAKKTKFDAEQLSDLEDADDDDLISRIRQGPGAEQSSRARAGSEHSLGTSASPRPSNVESPGASNSSPAAIGNSSATRALQDSDDDMPQPSKRRRLVVDSDED